MNRLEAIVAQLERVDLLKRKALARELAGHALPESLRRRANAVLPAAMALPERLPERVGETWLLLAKSDGQGLVARVGTGRSHKPLGAATLRAARAALVHAAGHACRALPSDARDLAEIYVQDDLDAAVTGRSAELSAAVALMSLALGRPPHAHVAGTARLSLEGKLEPVHHLREKLGALRLEWPLVTKVVVAREQGDIEDACGLEGIEAVRAADLGEALLAYGLDVRELALSDIDDHESRVGRLKTEGEKEGADFERLAKDAWESASVLSESHSDLAAKARGYAALFRLHLGESHEAWTMLCGVERKRLADEPEILAMVDTFGASAAIDVGDLEQAKSLARTAMETLGAPRSREHGAMVASARGTYGRAYLHAGEYVEAIEHLSRAVDLHGTYAPFEVPRSRGYLATALRLAGRLDQARTTLDLALEQNARDAKKRSASRQTTPFLELEAGRLAAAEGRLDEAERHLVAVGGDPTSYPDLGALRSRVLVALRRNDTARARALAETCVTLVVPGAKASALLLVGAVGYAELVVAGVATPDEEARALTLLSRAFGRSIEVGDVATTVSRQVF